MHNSIMSFRNYRTRSLGMKLILTFMLLFIIVQVWAMKGVVHLTDYKYDVANINKFNRVIGHLTGLQICGDAWPPPQHLDPEVNQDAVTLIQSKGYPAETHEVTTYDGYILTLIRIPHGVERAKRARRADPARPAVLLMHGLLDCCVTWINNLANESAGFVLADAGFDVWLGNSRGNTYARRHTHLTPKDKAFWMFSWDMMAKYDLPATIDEVLRVTGQKQLFYVGHSQGTEIGFAAFSNNATLAQKVRSFYALGPVTTVGNIVSPIKYVAPFAQSLAAVIEIFGEGEFLPSDSIIKFLAKWVCGNQLSPICSNIIFLMCGYDCKYTNITRLPVYVAHTPAGTSAMNLVHYAQSIMTKRFQMYDYGEEQNMIVYGQPTPPLYDARKMTVPTALIWGGKDWLADPQDVKLLLPQISNLLYSQLVPDYDHLDFVWGYNAKVILYDRMIANMKSLL